MKTVSELAAETETALREVCEAYNAAKRSASGLATVSPRSLYLVLVLACAAIDVPLELTAPS